MAQDDRWLNDDEVAAWRALVTVLTRLPAALDAQLRDDAGITHFEYALMAWLSESDGRRLPMKELARLSDGSLSRLSHCVTRLEGRGWVRRHPDPDDRRVTIAHLTAAGMRQVVAAAPGHVDEVRRLVFEPLTAEQIVELAAIAGRIAECLDAEVDPPAPVKERGRAQRPPTGGRTRG